MKKFTYKEWRSKGFQVNTGQKSTERNEAGEALFFENQVTKSLSINQEKKENDGCMVYQTYQEWFDKGYHVNKGESAVGRNNLGKYIFSEKQVSKTEFKRGKRSRRSFIEYDEQYEKEMDQDYGLDGW